MHATTHSATIRGIEAIAVEIETDIGRGLPGVTLLGLPDMGVREGRDRVRAAVRASGYEFPSHKVTVNMAPSDLRKEGPAFDLALALGLLAATGQLAPPAPEGGGAGPGGRRVGTVPAVEGGEDEDDDEAPRLYDVDLDAPGGIAVTRKRLPRRHVSDVALARLREHLVVGELALDGRVRGVRGAIAMADVARRLGFRRILLPAENAREATIVEGVEVLPVAHLREAVDHLSGVAPIAPAGADGARPATRREDAPDVRDVRGHAAGKRALLVAAAGGHNILLSGPPGSGKTMLAMRLPGLLPPLDFEAALEATRIHSVAGLLDPDAGLLREAPFRAPHHTVSTAALVGGGSGHIRPGEVTLAHRGVLFLDELPEFERRSLEALRQPLEEGVARISRSSGSLELPARFLCVAAMNPCPCGRAGSVASGEKPCTCGAIFVQRYRARVSGPLRDRFDLQLEVPTPRVTELRGAPDGPTTAELRERVLLARERQARRGAQNHRLGGDALSDACRLDAAAESLLRKAIEAKGISGRGVTRLLRVSRTIADLAGAERVDADHLLEAVQFRVADVPASG